MTLKTVNKTDMAQKNQHAICRLEVLQPLGPKMKDFGERKEVRIMLLSPARSQKRIQRPHLALCTTDAPVKLDPFQSHFPAGFRLVTIQRSYLGNTEPGQSFW